MKTNIVSGLLLGLIILFGSCENKRNDDSAEAAEEQNDEKLENSDLKKDSDFAVEATDGSLFEVQMGTLVSTRATSPDVKKFAEMIVNDHTKANDELRSIAGAKGIALPDVICEKCQKKYYDLDQKKGTDFDKEYIDMMVKDHKNDIDKFEKEADKGNDTEIKAWASEKLPALRHHLEEAERIQKVLSNNKRTNG